ncbi:hypothetical protein FHR83_001742 [Actinoplanes campanulatus]|uniref:Bulb-type lectin domain-containing protein n=1 Tax=Actinoplanes campanulatus TaxID=113559 RepID=A0A7W5AD55_9ACTN|nr:LamG-like jellyroll fold domain-containing protein [Actinoplanes campanulatus]MBB3094093.1 hypothetical protein [Actinoplanes campanulatus]
MTIAGLGVPSLATPAVATCSDVAGTESAAVEMAASCGVPVVVDALRNEYSQVIAQPDGRMTFESSVQPARVRRGAGWADVDLRLSPGADGLLRPAASVADVAFSNGGIAPLVTLTRGGRTMTMSWPGTLPPPTVFENSATYTEVLSGVDLVVRATETGFTHVLVIKSATAATQDAVREVHFDLGGDAEIQPIGSGLRAVHNGSVLASTEPAMMWDSRTTSTATPQTRSVQQTQPPTPSTDEAAGDAARTAPVSVALAGGDLVLRPDATLLEGAAFPLYVDPKWSIADAKWAYATNNGSTNTDYSTARVGLNPDTGALYRSFFQFNMTVGKWTLIGKHIESAHIDMKLEHSWSCDKTIASMYWTSAINATMKATWSAMDLLRYLASASGRANQAGGCGVIQGDQDMIFTGEPVRKFVQEASDKSWPNVTVGFTARDSGGDGESTQARWKKFLPDNAVLQANYDNRPTAPTKLQVAGMTCGTGAVSVGTLTPTFTATFNDPDGADDSLTGAYEWIEVPAAGMGAVTNTSPARKTAPPNKTSVTPGSAATSAEVSVVKNKKYAFRAKATDRDPYFQTGPWSAWCQFYVDTEVPPVTGTVIANASAPGRKVRIRIESTATDVTKFQYGWDAATKAVAASTTTPKFAEVEVTARNLGTNSLQLKAIDATLNEGTGVVNFTVVGQPVAPVARWGLETDPGTSVTGALADRLPAPVDSPLTAANVIWEDNARLRDAKTATFNGTSSAATTNAAVVNTAGSFSVGAWVRLDAPPTADLKFAAQDGADAAGFELGVRRSGTTPAPYWSFVMKDTSAQSSVVAAVLSPSALTTADTGRWTHVAGAFDAVEKKMRLFVDGTLVAEADRTAAPWSATGRFAVGRGFAGGVASGFWKGAIADVQVFDRVLVPEDFTGRLASDPDGNGFDEPGILTPIQVGAWNFEAATWCRRADLRDYCEAPDPRTAWGRWLALSRGSDIGAGRDTTKFGLWLDDQYFPAGDGTEPESTSEYGRSAVKTGLTPPDDDGNEYTLWQDRPVLRTDVSYTVSVWAMPATGQTGNHAVVAQRGTNESAFSLRYQADANEWTFAVGSQDSENADASTIHNTTAPDAVAGVWTHLTAVYDASAKQTRLYVNGQRQNATTLPEAPFNAGGPLLVGQSLHHGALTDQWRGGIDDIAVFQGAMTDAAVALMYEHQITDTSAANVLGENEVMKGGDILRSSDSLYQLRMQTDGNLVLYRNGAAVWTPNTWGNPGAETVMQPDGNLVIYRANKTPAWDTKTYGTAADRLVLFDDGRLELHDLAGQVIWRR